MPNGLNQEMFVPADQQAARAELGLPPTGKLLAYVGRLTPVKGPDLAVEALALLPEASLVIVGSGSLEASLKQRAQELGVAGRIIWAGPQPHRRIPRYLAACDALVLPSRSEGDPNAVLEALGCGRPVAAAQVGGVSQVVSEAGNGALFPPDDPQALAQAARRGAECPVGAPRPGPGGGGAQLAGQRGRPVRGAGPGRQGRGMKRVMLISYLWPPAAGAGVHRPVKFARYLRRFGWDPMVLTARRPAALAHDPGLAATLPPDLNVVRLANVEAGGGGGRSLGRGLRRLA